MQPLTSGPPSHLTRESAEMLRRNSGWIVALGVFLIVLGILAISFSFVAGIVEMLLFGWALLLGGFAEVFQSFMTRRWLGFFIRLLLGVFHILVGALVLMRPYCALQLFTMILAIFF